MITDIDIPIAVEARLAWRFAGGWNLLPVISSGCVSSKLADGGRLRILTNKDGSLLWERLLSFEEEAMTLSYRIVDAKGFNGAYGVGYIGRVEIMSNSGRCSILRYSADFEPSEGWSESSARQAVRDFASDCGIGIARAASRLDR